MSLPLLLCYFSVSQYINTSSVRLTFCLYVTSALPLGRNADLVRNNSLVEEVSRHFYRRHFHRRRRHFRRRHRRHPRRRPTFEKIFLEFRRDGGLPVFIP